MAREIEKLVDTFNQTNEYQIFVTISSPGSAQQVFQRSEAGLQDGNAPQIVVAPTEELAYWHKMGNLITLDGYLNDLQYGFSTELIEDFLPLFGIKTSLIHTGWGFQSHAMLIFSCKI